MKVILLAVCIAFSSAAWCRDLGVVGETFPIIETDFIEMIQERLAEKVENGELDALHEGMKKQAIDYTRRPVGADLPPAREYRAVEINPVLTLDHDITDAEGKVLFQAGTQINPLHARPLTKWLCFFDGDDAAQVGWILSKCGDKPLNKLIMTNGDIAALSETHKRRFYFDQKGALIERFTILALPAVVRQSGDLLYVEEFPVH